MSVPGLPVSRPRAGGDAHGRRAASGGPAGGRPLPAGLRGAPGARPFPNREAALRLAGETVLERLEARLSLLSVLARLAPLMGLLGTILGMITTFSRIAEARSGVDMSLLAGGNLAGPADHGGGAVHRHSRAVFPVLLSRQGAPRGRRPEQGRKRGSAGRRRAGHHRSGRGGTASARRHSPWGRHGTANAGRHGGRGLLPGIAGTSRQRSGGPGSPAMPG